MFKAEKHIVALSGGKDSTAMALSLRERYPEREFIFVCTPTGDELPEMIDHWRALGRMLGVLVTPILAKRSLQGLIREQKMLPNHRARFCTRILKLQPYYRWLETQKPCVSYVGLRADEEGRAGMSFVDFDGITMRFPLREWGWTEARVWEYLDQRKVVVPARTDCARCYHQRLGEWWRLWKFYPDIYHDAEQQEIEISRVRGKPYTFRNASRDTWPASLADLKRRFEAGDVPRNTVVEKTVRMSQRSGSCRVCSL